MNIKGKASQNKNFLAFFFWSVNDELEQQGYVIIACNILSGIIVAMKYYFKELIIHSLRSPHYLSFYFAYQNVITTTNFNLYHEYNIPSIAGSQRIP